MNARKMRFSPHVIARTPSTPHPARDRPARANSGISSMHRTGGVHTIKTYLCNALSVCPGTEECLSSHHLSTGPAYVGTVPGIGLLWSLIGRQENCLNARWEVKPTNALLRLARE